MLVPLDAVSSLSPVNIGLYFLVRGSLVILLLVMYYISGIKRTFAGVPQLAKPWVMLQVGVASLLLTLLLDVAKGLTGYSGPLWDQIGDVVLFVAAVFFLLGTMMMKKAWTIPSSE